MIDQSKPLARQFFGTPLNAAITVAVSAALVLIAVPLLRWALIDATWTGTAETCAAGTGACWAFIGEKFRFMLFGLYPRERQWQAITATLLIALPVVATAIPRFWHRQLLTLWLLSIVSAIVLMSGWISGSSISTQLWGGFPLTLLLAVLGFAGAFPLGVLLALGRRSRMGGVRMLSIGFIEAMRGVPIIAVLYVSTLLFPLMLPAGASIDKLLRVQVALILFVSAYIAEIVRAGLEAVPNGQYEAAQSLGLSAARTLRLVVLPQAFRAVIPAFVTLGIGIFLDTSLVSVIGLFDFLNTARVATTDTQWLGFYHEAYAVTAAVYFAFAYAASRYSLWLEAYLRPLTVEKEKDSRASVESVAQRLQTVS
ncbi:amino acid ABC transporter permease [Taklimakanibacter deserti]|uniref:amino acid ABC transporter permease n=1 Tax=Taklimakanibacter deserti TaxID=2267839 RepID=UPI000E65E19D